MDVISEEAMQQPADAATTDDDAGSESIPLISPPVKSNLSVRSVTVVMLIFGAVLLERMMFYSFEVQLPRIISFYYDRDIARNLSAMFATFQFVPLLGGWLGDCFIGAYRCVIIGLILNFVGSCFMLDFLPKITETWTPMVPTSFTAPDLCIFIIGMIFIALGTLFFRCNLLTFAASVIPDDRLVDTSFFLWYYFFVNIGAVSGYSLTASDWLSTSVIAWPILLGVAVVLVALARCTCFTEVPSHRPSTYSWRVVSMSFAQNMPSCCRERDSTRVPDRHREQMRHRENKLQTLYVHMQKLLILTSFYIYFHFVYITQGGIVSEIQSTMPNQTLMNDTEHRSNDKALFWGQMCRPIFIVALAPFTHWLILPFLRKFWPSVLEQLKLIGIGMFVIVLACIAAIIVEVIRHSTYWTTYDIILCRIPQFILLGLAEVFANVCGYEFMYFEAPSGLRGSMLGLIFCTDGLASYLNVGVTYIVKKYYPWYVAATPEDSNLEPYLGIIAGIQLVLILLYAVLVRRYKYTWQHGAAVTKFRENESDGREDSLFRSVNFASSSAHYGTHYGT